LILLTLFTLVAGLVVAAYQLWSAGDAKAKGSHSALTGHYGKSAVFPDMAAEPERRRSF
jgi:hypothetical protein